MHQLKVGNLPLPKLYVCEDKAEADKCRSMGIPYLIRPEDTSDDYLVKAVLWRTLKNKFRYIRWDEVLGLDQYDVSQLIVHCPSDARVTDGAKGFSGIEMEVTDEYRMTDGGSDEEYDLVDRNIEQYVGDLGWYVDVEELQSLKILPTFLDDIATAIKRNINATMWMDGWNKKLDCNLGSYQGSDDAPNLIILDTSGSIPRGVAGTMIALIDTLRHQANAYLIITSFTSKIWEPNEDLPRQSELMDMIGGANECVQFYDILRKHILGRHWGNVIVFGDNDAPDESRFRKFASHQIKTTEMQSTRIDRLMAFHTYERVVPGYGRWVLDILDPKAEIIYNTDWTRSMRR